MKKFLIKPNWVLYFPSFPRLISSSDTQPLWLIFLLSRIRLKRNQVINFLLICCVFLSELLLSGHEYPKIKVIVFLVFLFLSFYSTLKLDFVRLSANSPILFIIVLGLLTIILPINHFFHDRGPPDGFRSFAYTFPEASYASKFFFLASVFRIMIFGKVNIFWKILPLSTFSLTGLILSLILFIHQSLFSLRSLFVNLTFLVVCVFVLFNFNSYFSLGRISDIVNNASNLGEFILSDDSFQTRLLYFKSDELRRSLPSLLSIFIEFKITTIALAVNFLVFIKFYLRLPHKALLLLTFLIMGYSDTYIHPFLILLIQLCRRKEYAPNYHSNV